MSKTNFSKVESALEEGLRQISIQKLFELADEASGIVHKEKTDPSIAPLTIEQKRLLRSLQLNLSRLEKVEKKIYTKIGTKKSTFKLLLSTPSEPKSWTQLEEIHKKTEELVKQHFPVLSDEEQVEKELNRHLTKRFNVNEKWLPLH